MIQLLSVSIAVLLLFTGCKNAERWGLKPAGTETGIALPAGAFRLISLNGIKPEQAEISSQITLNINPSDSILSGFAGCNRFFGSFSRINDTIQIGWISSTKMACAMLNSEEIYLNSLSGQHYSWRQSGDTLRLINRKHTLLFGKTNQ
jgi:heat shock protein HslJ